MSNKSKDTTDKERDAILKRMLETPPKPKGKLAVSSNRAAIKAKAKK